MHPYFCCLWKISKNGDIIEHMSELSRLHLLSQQLHLEPAEDANCPQLSKHKGDEVYISNAVLPNGTQISLLKTLLTSVCERDCNYCPFRAGRDFRRASFQPDEFAKLFMYMHNIGKVDGIFLSSGIVGGGIHTQDMLLDTATIMRKKYQYRGYLHLKIMPGAERNQVEQAMVLSDRISINLEAPNHMRLKKLAPTKKFQEELIEPIKWAHEIRKNQDPINSWQGKWPSTVTQFVVGGADESDLEILLVTEKLHHQTSLARAYFSAFNPVPDTPLENKTPTPLLRQNRLYQASYLIRDYGYSMEEMPFEDSGNLPLNKDPKLALAQKLFEANPIEINKASRELLLRIPGIGPKGAISILKARRNHKIRSLTNLTKLGLHAKKVAPFILLDGKRPSYQMKLFNL
jgi:predicted DNA-binding helix-hairpin-helix protein